MHTSIVVPLDGSEFGNRALPIAVALAHRSDAALHLVHVREPVGLPEGGAADIARYDEQQDQLQRGLMVVAERLARDSSLRVDTALLEGPVVPSLQEYLAGGQHDLVVMMTHGHGGVSRMWLGNVADGLIRHVSTPLLLLRRNQNWLSDAEEPLFRRILIPLDGSPLAEAVLDRVLSLATPDVTVHVLLTVIVPPFPVAQPPGEIVTFTGRGDEALQRTAALRYLLAIAEELRATGALVEVHVEEHPGDAQGILDTATEQHADLIALSTHGRGSVSRLVYGSVADKVMRGATIPVLVYRPPHAESAPRTPGRQYHAGIVPASGSEGGWTSPGSL
jgi:nucleotide-binding universal stress UspA family protein